MATVTTHTGKYTPSYEGAVQRTLAGKIEDAAVNIRDFGAACDDPGDGTGTDDTAAIEAAMDEVAALGGGYVDVPIGYTRTTTPIAPRPGVILRGQGMSRWGGIPKATIVNKDSDLFHVTETVYGHGYVGLNLTSLAGGGHIFHYDDILTANIPFSHLGLFQKNADKCALLVGEDENDDAGFFGNFFDHCTVEYHVANSVPAFNINLKTINQLHFSRMRFQRPTVASGGDYAVFIESTANSVSVAGVEFDQITFQQPGGGAIKMNGSYGSAIRNSGVYDLSSGSSNPLFSFGTKSGGLASKGMAVEGLVSTLAGGSVADLFIDTAGTGASFLVAGCVLGRLDGNSASANSQAATLLGNAITTKVNLADTDLAGRRFTISGTAGTVTSFGFRRGATGDYDGYVLQLLNGGIIGAYDSTGNLRIGTTPTSPTTILLKDGNIQASNLPTTAPASGRLWVKTAAVGALTENGGAIGGTNDGNIPDLSGTPDTATLVAAVRELAAKVNALQAEIDSPLVKRVP